MLATDSGVDPARLVVLPLGVDPGRFRPGAPPFDPAAIGERLGDVHAPDRSAAFEVGQRVHVLEIDGATALVAG